MLIEEKKEKRRSDGGEGWEEEKDLIVYSVIGNCSWITLVCIILDRDSGGSEEEQLVDRLPLLGHLWPINFILYIGVSYADCVSKKVIKNKIIIDSFFFCLQTKVALFSLEELSDPPLDREGVW